MKQLMVVIGFSGLFSLKLYGFCCKKNEDSPKTLQTQKTTFSLKDLVYAEWFLNALIACQDEQEVRLSLEEFVDAYKYKYDSSDSDSSPESATEKHEHSG